MKERKEERKCKKERRQRGRKGEEAKDIDPIPVFGLRSGGSGDTLIGLHLRGIYYTSQLLELTQTLQLLFSFLLFFFLLNK